jgi:Sel1 repeat
MLRGVLSSLLLLFFIGSVSAQHPDDQTRERMLIAKAESGDVDSQMWLGVAYERGQFGKANLKEALKWLSLSAEQGNPDAQNALGGMYESGRGVPQNDQMAAEWYRKAAEHDPDLGGASQGRNHLGLISLEGRGVPKDIVQAYMWFKLESPSNINLLTTKSRMTSEQIRQGDDLVAKRKGQGQDPANTSSQDLSRRLVIIGLLRSINTAEASNKYASQRSSYLRWPDLLATSPSLADLRILAEIDPKLADVQLGREPEILPGVNLRLNVHADGQGYDVRLEDLADKNCYYAAVSDETGVIRQSKALDCDIP